MVVASRAFSGGKPGTIKVRSILLRRLIWELHERGSTRQLPRAVRQRADAPCSYRVLQEFYSAAQRTRKAVESIGTTDWRVLDTARVCANDENKTQAVSKKKVLWIFPRFATFSAQERRLRTLHARRYARILSRRHQDFYGRPLSRECRCSGTHANRWSALAVLRAASVGRPAGCLPPDYAVVPLAMVGTKDRDALATYGVSHSL
ncbi:hypothetical protein MTO96_006101 [Rhipicephalus appendiculatus]